MLHEKMDFSVFYGNGPQYYVYFMKRPYWPDGLASKDYPHGHRADKDF